MPGSVKWWKMRGPPETCRQGQEPAGPQRPTDGAGPLLDVPTAGAPHAGPTHAPSQHSGCFGPPSWHIRTASPASSASSSQGKGRVPALPSPYFQCSQELLLCSGPGKLQTIQYCIQNSGPHSKLTFNFNALGVWPALRGKETPQKHGEAPRQTQRRRVGSCHEGRQSSAQPRAPCW